jgi:hypothetical protein
MFLAVAVCVSTGGCAREAVQQSTSRDGRYTAAVGRLNGGAMTSFIWIVTLRPAPSRLTWFTDEVFVINGAESVGVQWNGGELVIVCDDCQKERAEKMAASWRDVTLVYRGRP